MILLILFAFLAGMVTIFSPCILPILPIVLSGSITGGKKRPLGVITGFIVSFTFFTLALSEIVNKTGISPDALRLVSVVVVFLFGLSLLFGRLHILMETLFSRITSLISPKINQNHPNRSDFIAGMFIGTSLGIVWTPCVGPILASVIALAVSGNVSASAVAITLAYSLGTAIPLLFITYGGKQLLQKIPNFPVHTVRIQKIFGIVMIATAVAIQYNIDRNFQLFILTKFPNYGAGLTKFEDTLVVRNSLEQLQTKPIDDRKKSELMNDFLESDKGNAPEFIPGGEWMNSDPFTLKSLRGTVVLVDFWTYTCINCIRTLPYLKTWHEKYKDKGLVIVGVHTPEFEFEKNPDNVKKAIKDFAIKYPVMQDNDFATWNAYANRYWPAKYLIDANGKIRYTHFGEGDYDETEQKIQELLEEAGSLKQQIQINNPDYNVQARTGETYLGYRRMSGLISPEKIKVDDVFTYTTPANLNKNSFGLSGTWLIADEYARPDTGASLTYHFDAKEVFLVMRPKSEGLTGNIRVTLDAQTITKEFAGEDILDGFVSVNADRLYKIIKLNKPGEHILKLEFLDDNVELYAFTFG